MIFHAETEPRSGDTRPTAPRRARPFGPLCRLVGRLVLIAMFIVGVIGSISHPALAGTPICQLDRYGDFQREESIISERIVSENFREYSVSEIELSRADLAQVTFVRIANCSDIYCATFAFVNPGLNSNGGIGLDFVGYTSGRPLFIESKEAHAKSAEAVKSWSSRNPNYHNKYRGCIAQILLFESVDGFLVYEHPTYALES